MSPARYAESLRTGNVAEKLDAADRLGRHCLRLTERPDDPQLREILNELSAALADESPRVREAAARALGCGGVAAGPATSELIRCLGDKDAHVRAGAANALYSIGPAARRATPSLLAALNDDDAAVRGIAVRALARVVPWDQVVAKDLASRLHNENDHVQMAILDALEEMGGAAKPALGEIRRLTEDSTGIVRTRAMRAAEKISASPGK
jgi:HEAT repeat protein